MFDNKVLLFKFKINSFFEVYKIITRKNLYDMVHNSHDNYTIFRDNRRLSQRCISGFRINEIPL